MTTRREQLEADERHLADRVAAGFAECIEELGQLLELAELDGDGVHLRGRDVRVRWDALERRVQSTRDLGERLRRVRKRLDRLEAEPEGPAPAA